MIPMESGKALSLPDVQTSKEFIDSAMEMKMYADAMNEVVKWIRSNAHLYAEDTRHELNATITLSLPGVGDIPFYICTFGYTVAANELRAYLFFPEPGSVDPAASNPFRMYLSTKKIDAGNYSSDFAWASYDDAEMPEASSGERDYLSSYYFRVEAGSGKGLYYIKGATDEYASYGELELLDKLNCYGSIKTASPDGTGGIHKNLVYADAEGFYIHLDEEAGGFEDNGTNIGDFYISRNYSYDSGFTTWPDAFTNLLASWGGAGELALMSAYNVAEHVPAFNDSMFKLIWPDEWQTLLAEGEL